MIPRLGQGTERHERQLPDGELGSCLGRKEAPSNSTLKLTGFVAERVFLAALFASRKAAVVMAASSGRDWGARSLTLVVSRRPGIRSRTPEGRLVDSEH